MISMGVFIFEDVHQLVVWIEYLKTPKPHLP